MRKIVCIDDNSSDVEYLDMILPDGFELSVFRTIDSLLSAKFPRLADIILLDLDFDGGRGADLFDFVRRAFGPCPLVLMARADCLKTAVDLLKRGASDCLEKPLERMEFRSALFRGLGERNVQSSFDYERYAVPPGDLSARLCSLARQIADSPLPAVIYGERGSGKLFLSRYIHSLAFAQFDGPDLHSERHFRILSCEDSIGDRQKVADSRLAIRVPENFLTGTIVFDKLDTSPPEWQKALIDFVKAHTFAARFRIRILATAEKDLGDMVQKAEINPELYFLFSTGVLKIPPLRDRREDIPFLAWSFLREAIHTKPGLAAREFSPEAMDYLYSSEWSGNIAELKIRVFQAAWKCKIEKIGRELLLGAGMLLSQCSWLSDAMSLFVGAA